MLYKNSRGGGWYYVVESSRTLDWDSDMADYRYDVVGFRVMRVGDQFKYIRDGVCNFDSVDIKTLFRYENDPFDRSFCVGFRVVR